MVVTEVAQEMEAGMVTEMLALDVASDATCEMTIAGIHESHRVVN